MKAGQGETLAEVRLAQLTADDRERFILDNQEAFNYGALEEFGRRDDHFEEDGEIISRETIERSIDGGEAYRPGDLPWESFISVFWCFNNSCGSSFPLSSASQTPSPFGYRRTGQALGRQKAPLWGKCPMGEWGYAFALATACSGGGRGYRSPRDLS